MRRGAPPTRDVGYFLLPPSSPLPPPLPLPLSLSFPPPHPIPQIGAVSSKERSSGKVGRREKTGGGGDAKGKEMKELNKDKIKNAQNSRKRGGALTKREKVSTRKTKTQGERHNSKRKKEDDRVNLVPPPPPAAKSFKSSS